LFKLHHTYDHIENDPLTFLLISGGSLDETNEYLSFYVGNSKNLSYLINAEDEQTFYSLTEVVLGFCHCILQGENDVVA